MIEFSLPDMSCDHCVKHITQTIQTIDPNASIAVQLTLKRVSIDSKQDAALFAQALNEEGYPVASEPSEPEEKS